MEKITKPKLVFFQWRHEGVAKFLLLHKQQHIKCLSEFFEVITISEDCDYQQICDRYQPEITLFESGVPIVPCQRLKIKNTSAYPEIPKLGLYNGDPFCGCRSVFISDMEHWDIKTFFSISISLAEYTPEIADNLFYWPNFVDADIYQDYGISKNVPVIFTGSHSLLYPWRQQINNIVSSYYPSLICPHLGYEEQTASRMISGQQYARMLNASWFVPTCGTMAKEVVRRHFEAPASKSCLITEQTPAVEACGFIDMQNCVFANGSDVLDKLDYLFQHLDKLERITNAGYQLVHSRHTIKQRDQILQWLKLHKSLKPGQRIVQTNPFEPLTIVEESSGITNSHIIGHGLDRQLLRQGDEKLWAGEYDEAEALYLSCLNYLSYIPEPKLRLALCNLYKGNTAAALHWIVQPINWTLGNYQAPAPDPIEWAYFIIALLCQGNLTDAIQRANQFPSLFHIELDRTRWVIDVLKNKGHKVAVPHSDGARSRKSVHQLPERSFNDWIDNFCIVLKACQQFSLAETLSNSVSSEYQSLEKQQSTAAPMSSSLPTSDLDYIIPAEVKNDEFFYAIQKLAREEDIKTVLEIGSSAGEGSTEAFVTGIRENPNKPTLFCMEVSTPRFAELQKRYANDSFVKCYNVSSVSLEQFPNENEVVAFYNTYQTALNHYPLDRVLGWLRQDIEYVKNLEITDNGIRKIKQQNKIRFFDMVLIDGSEFTGVAELDEVYGARFVLLDDINAFKNYNNYRRIIADTNYTLVTQNPFLRNGYAIFKKVNNEIFCQSPALPIHFFTIVLNGEPFTRYHIDVFKQLAFQWHWHIIEGVADLKHDTAWSLRNGGRVTDEVHRNGRSNDGTTEYLDELARLYPENVTVYRKPEGVFWDGKREMVNAPLANINEECLLWQVDVDELWTVEQILSARKMFINNPDKTAAFYWCWYFVGENLVISTRNCYAQNPQQEWLRTWRFKPGAVWAAHEPPRLAEPLPNGEWRDVATVNPFLHEETDQLGLIFQHFAYVTPQQLRFKEQYYGYTNAVSGWMELQAQTQFPVLLRQYFPWVQDGTQVDTANSCSLVPIAQREAGGEVWRFLQVEELQRQPVKIENSSLTIIVDGVFFQLYKTGIARVWHSLLEEWADNGFAKHIVVLDRAGTAPAIPGIRYRPVPPYDYGKTDADREMLQQVCDEEGADLFISSYYTTPLSTPSVFMAHDMIPELMGWDLNHPMWREKHYGIQHANAYIAVSENTARDLVKVFPDIALESVTVAKNGVNHKKFSPAIPEKISRFKTKYGISKPYFILVGSGGYKNTILFFKAFAQLFSKHGFEIVCTGSGWLLETELRNYTSGSVVHMLQLSDEELSIAYSGAVALVYPSKYEGFGLPVLEAIACGCPVITCPNASIPEVAGEAALYVNDDDVERLTNALCDVQKPNIRNSLIAAGLEQAKKFSWSKMAKTVSSALIDATLLPLNLKDINLIVFPDWCQPEESLCFELEQVIKALATHPDSSQITLLVNNGKIPDDEATLILSSVSMNLLLQEDLDVSEGPEISLVGQLSEMQWEALLPRIHARIVLKNENQGAIAQLKAETIPFCELVSFSNEQAAQLKPGIWDITGHSEIIYFNRGMALRKQGKIAEAVSSYQKALEIKPDFAEASYQLSLARYENQIISKGYQFTQDWFSFNIPILEQHLKRFINIPTLNVIEIGSWEGRSTCWLIDNILTHESNRITCIDTFEGSIEHVQLYRFENRYIQSIEGRFDFNIVRTGVPEKVQKIVAKSNEVMRTLPLNCYDIVYIDGSHIASDVLEDAVLVWQLVKVGGFIIFDDYFFTFPQNPAWNTKIGIDAFMMSFKDKSRVIHKAEQVILEKTSL